MIGTHKHAEELVEIGSLKLSGWAGLRPMILLISASQVARIWEHATAPSQPIDVAFMNFVLFC
jgi:hypothetical protein